MTRYIVNRVQSQLTNWEDIFATYNIDKGQVVTNLNTSLLLLLSLQSCPTLCDPIDGAHQAPPSLGFSRQEHWSGLPFPSPMHESEK